MSALVVYKKELKETLRDRRTLAAMVLVPMVLYPATVLITTEAMVAEQRTADEGQLSVGAPPELPQDLAQFLASQPRLQFTSLASGPYDTARARQELQGGLHVLITVNATSAEALRQDRTADLKLYVDATQPSGDGPESRMRAILRDYSRSTVRRRLQAHALEPELARPLKIDVRSVATPDERGNHLLGMILPSLVLLFVALSSLYPAIDLTAGEKERKTLATLLTTPVPLSQLVLGKLLAVVTVGTLAGALNVSALGLTFLRVMHGAAPATQVSFEIGLGTILGFVGAVLAAAFPLAALMLLFASFARSFRDANLLLTPVLLLAMAPAGLVMLPGAELDSAFCLVPIANAALWMKALLSGTVSADRVLLVILSSAGSTAFMAAAVVRAFGDERALFSVQGRRADFARLLFEPPRPGLGSALAFVAVGFTMSFFVGLLSSGQPIVTVVLTQVLGYLLPAVGLAVWMRSRMRPHRMLGLSPPPPAALVAGVMVGASGWLGLSLPGAWLTDFVAGGQADAAAALAAALQLADSPFWVLIAALALLPAIAEELGFRGVLYRLLGSTRTAVLIQAVLFGLVHGSIYRFLPTFLLGLALGALRRRSGSVWPGVIAHALSNGIVLAIGRYGGPQIEAQLKAPSLWVFVGLAVLISGFVVLRFSKRPQTHEN